MVSWQTFTIQSMFDFFIEQLHLTFFWSILCWVILSSQSAIFNFQSLLTVVLLLICTCAYIRSIYPALLDKNKTG